MNIDLKKIKKVIELIEQSGICEIELKEGEESIKICKPQHINANHIASMVIPSSPPFNSNLYANANPNYINHSAKPSESSSEFSNAITVNNEKSTVKSPMVGTFYRSSSPNTKPFVEVGDHVKIGDVLCIVEAMKMFNQIEAEFAGNIKSILVETGQPVEYGQALFIINPD